MRYKQVLLTLFFLPVATFIFSQKILTDSLRSARYDFMPLDRQEDLMVNSVYLSSTPNKRIHTGIRPYRYEMFDRMEWDGESFDWNEGLFRHFYDLKGIPANAVAEYKHFRGDGKFASWLHNKWFNESLIYIKSSNPNAPEEFNISINPVIYLEAAPGEGAIPFYFLNGRGLWINGNFGKISFYTMLGENQGRFPRFYNNYYSDRKFAHGWGYRKSFKEEGHDFAMVMGEISYTPSNYFNFTLGHGKHFWGEGYRSLFLSDFALPFPFFKIETSLGAIKYINLWAVHGDATVGAGSDVFPNKYTSMHLLSWNITSRWNIQFFEANVWASDSSGRGGFNVNFLNPIIFYRTVELQTGFGGGNALAGISSSFNLGRGYKVYGQFILDDFKLSAFRQRKEGHWLNLYGFQFGALKAGTASRLNYTLGVEWNRVNPFVYSHRTSATNYVHLNYPLAHPWGAGFREILLHGQLRYKRWFTEVFFSVGNAGRDTSGINLGNDLTRSYQDRELGDLGYFFPTGNTATIVNAQISFGYNINISTGMRVEAGVRFRREKHKFPDLIQDNPFNWYFIGLRTSLFNRYYDL